MNENLKKNLRILIIIILVLINVIILINNLIKNEKAKITNNNQINEVNDIVDYNIIEDEYADDEDNNENVENAVEYTSSISNSQISSMNESARVKTYFGEFLSYLDNKNYEKAYAMLNSDYKTNYFPTLEEFETYIQENFPSGKLVASYNSFDRKGEIYVINVSIYSLSGSKDNAVTKDVVIRENGTNDFTLSFSK